MIKKITKKATDKRVKAVFELLEIDKDQLKKIHAKNSKKKKKAKMKQLIGRKKSS